MSSLRRFVVLAIYVLPLTDMALATDDLYRCSDGTFTNRVERQCEAYESTGIVRIQGATIEAAKTAVKADEHKPPLEVKGANESAKVEDSRR
jgi:hypothetical protein